MLARALLAAAESDKAWRKDGAAFHPLFPTTMLAQALLASAKSGRY